MAKKRSGKAAGRKGQASRPTIELYDDRVMGDVIQGDQVLGDVVTGDRITVGAIEGSTGIAIGRGAQATVSAGLSAEELEGLFAPLTAALNGLAASQQKEARRRADALKEELAKGDKADDRTMARLLEGLARYGPPVVQCLVGLFVTPVLGGIAGPVTAYVVEQLRGAMHV